MELTVKKTRHKYIRAKPKRKRKYLKQPEKRHTHTHSHRHPQDFPFSQTEIVKITYLGCPRPRHQAFESAALCTYVLSKPCKSDMLPEFLQNSVKESHANGQVPLFGLTRCSDFLLFKELSKFLKVKREALVRGLARHTLTLPLLKTSFHLHCLSLTR